MDGQKMTLKPDIKMFFIEHLGVFAFFMLLMLAAGYNDILVRVTALIMIVLCMVFLLLRLWYWSTVRWEITPTQIKSCHGVLNREVDYIELYRVVDYSENQNLLQQILGVKDIIIISSDRTHPSMRIYGLPGNLELIDVLKPLVKKCRQENQIYEIANH